MNRVQTRTDRMSLILTLLLMGLVFVVSLESQAARRKAPRATVQKSKRTATKPRVVYPKESKLDFEGLALQGEVRSPGEFYFQHRPEEKFDSLVKRRANFHREMLRDVVMSQ